MSLEKGLEGAGIGADMSSFLIGKEDFPEVGGGVLGTATNAELGVRASRILGCGMSRYNEVVTIELYVRVMHALLFIFGINS